MRGGGGDGGGGGGAKNNWNEQNKSDRRKRSDTAAAETSAEGQNGYFPFLCLKLFTTATSGHSDYDCGIHSNIARQRELLGSGRIHIRRGQTLREGNADSQIVRDSLLVRAPDP